MRPSGVSSVICCARLSRLNRHHATYGAIFGTKRGAGDALDVFWGDGGDRVYGGK
ncbi:MAG: hypothetical protein AAFY15_13230 [Cyanobacteria bacterium J06648_11]